MSKASGLGQSLFVAGYDLSGDVGSLSNVHSSVAVQDITGIDKSAHERLGLLVDGGLAFVAFFNKTAGQAHPVLSALPTSDVLLSYFAGSTLGNAVANLRAKQINYDGTRAQGGALTFVVTAQANGTGLEWSEALTAGKRTDTAATNGTGYDGGAATAFGLSAYLHVFALTGTNVIVALEDSANNSAWAAVTGGAFTSVTSAPGSERITTATGLTVRRYVRVVTTGTFTSATFAVSFLRPLVATVL